MHGVPAMIGEGCHPPNVVKKLFEAFYVHNMILSVLQEQVAKIGKCPFCHDKTLGEKYISDSPGYHANDCTLCGRIFITNKLQKKEPTTYGLVIVS